MRRSPHIVLLGVLVTAAALQAQRLCASEIDEFKVKRQEVFEFTEKPSVTRAGDKVTVSFTSKGFCDATVAIEDATGKIVRHLASGVLGPKAPEPFQKDSLKQSVVWDGKNDKGEYVDDRDGLVVRVSLGLKPQYEKNLRWEPRRRIAWQTLLMRAAPEGMYVFDTRGCDHLRLFDHEGNYVRTIYPFAAGELSRVKGLQWAEFPQDGQRLPLMVGPMQNTFLTSGDHTWTTRYWGAMEGLGATVMDVRGGRLVWGLQRLNRMAADPKAGAIDLEGPTVALARDPDTKKFSFLRDGELAESVKAGNRKDNPPFLPEDAALSPDGKWLYLAGYHRRRYIAGFSEWLDGVFRVGMEGAGQPELLAGGIGAGTKGKGPGRFSVPSSVAVDEAGRIYVADHANDRVQVLAADGKWLRDLAVTRPALVRVHRKTGQVFVFSWHVDAPYVLPKDDPWVEPTLTVFDPLDKGSGKATYPFPYCYTMRTGIGATQDNIYYSVELDSWTEPTTIWISTERHLGYGPARAVDWQPYFGRKPFASIGVKLLKFQGGRFTELADFARKAVESSATADAPKHGVEHLLVNPRDGVLFDAIYQGPVLRMDPESGKTTIVKEPPGGFGDFFTIGPDGCLYSVYEGGWIVRWDIDGGREIPFDYGEEVFDSGGKRRFISAVRLPGSHVIEFHGHWPGISVAENGNVACFFWNALRTIEQRGDSTIHKDRRAFTPALYPGRSVDFLVSVFDKHGRVSQADALPGVSMISGLAMDREGKLTAISVECRQFDGKPFVFPLTATLVKFDPKRTRLLSGGRAAVPMVVADDWRITERTVRGREVPTPMSGSPQRPPDVEGFWMEGAEWFYGGVGFFARRWCWCYNMSFASDRFGRSFVPETSHFSVAVLDPNGNLILRMGRYGNEEDGMPSVRTRCSPNPRSIGGDELALCRAAHVGVHTDHRLFVSDAGNDRIVSVKLGYHTEERVALKDVPDSVPLR